MSQKEEKFRTILTTLDCIIDFVENIPVARKELKVDLGKELTDREMFEQYFADEMKIEIDNLRFALNRDIQNAIDDGRLKLDGPQFQYDFIAHIDDDTFEELFITFDDFLGMLLDTTAVLELGERTLRIRTSTRTAELLYADRYTAKPIGEYLSRKDYPWGTEE
jgi:hypothetical protein